MFCFFLLFLPLSTKQKNKTIREHNVCSVCRGLSKEKQDDLKVFSELKGNTLRVYLLLLQNQSPMGIREVQKKLDFSSPTLAVYHLEKLENLGLAHKASGGYALNREIKVGALSQVVRFGSLLLPRYVFYTVLFSTMLACYFAAIWINGSFSFNINSGFAILLGITVIGVMVYECLRIVRQTPL